MGSMVVILRNITLLHVSFKQNGETMKKVTIYTIDDQTPEDDETLLVYIVPETTGVRIAKPSTDNGRKVNEHNTITNSMVHEVIE